MSEWCTSELNSRLLIFSVLIIGTIASANWVVDPFGFYWVPQIKKVSYKRTQAVNRSRLTKPYRLLLTQPEVLLVGNSRIEMGIQAESEQLKANSVYNVGIPGLKYEKQWQLAFEHMNSNPNLQKMILSFDYNDFLIDRALYDKVPNALLEQNNSVDMLKITESLFSLDTFANSMLTVLQHNNNMNHITERGTNIADGYIDIIETEGKSALFEQKLRELNGYFNKENSFASHTAIPHPYLPLLKQLFEKAQSKGIEMTLFINPYHTSYVKAIEIAGKLNDFCEWKKQLAYQVKRLNHVLWDFSLISPYASEETNFANNHSAMKWFWEPAHYKPELGEIILRIMLENDNASEYRSIESCESVSKKLVEYKEQWHLIEGII